MRELVQRKLVIIDAQETMKTAIEVMRERNISCIFASYQNELVGIITERDIVQKFTVLDRKEKLESKIEAFMTRPVRFARLAHLEDDVRTMFLQENFRHFPITTGGQKIDSIIGLVTVTDVAHAYLRGDYKEAAKAKLQPIVIIAGKASQRKNYETLFQALKFQVISDAMPEELIRIASQQGYPVILDVDDFPIEVAKVQLSALKNHPAVFIILSSEQQLVSPLSKLLTSEIHFVSLKPLDISYILRLLQTIGSQ